MAKILVVEDDVMNRDMLVRLLEWEGYQTIVAGDGVQAITVACAEHPDLILMDMGLPRLNGWLATQRIKRTQNLCATPVIALTAFAMVEDRERCMAAGCDEYETKPVDFVRLQAKINTLLAHHLEINEPPASTTGTPSRLL